MAIVLTVSTNLCKIMHDSVSHYRGVGSPDFSESVFRNLNKPLFKRGDTDPNGLRKPRRGTYK